jgi:hypothetical protein
VEPLPALWRQGNRLIEAVLTISVLCVRVSTVTVSARPLSPAIGSDEARLPARMPWPERGQHHLRGHGDAEHAGVQVGPSLAYRVDQQWHRGDQG